MRSAASLCQSRKALYQSSLRSPFITLPAHTAFSQTQSTSIFSAHPSMSEYSTLSTISDLSEFSNPPARRYRLHNMSPPQRMSLVWFPLPSFHYTSKKLTQSQAEKHETIVALQQHRINTLPSLRRVELAFAALNTPDVAEPMTAAWTYYVSSRGLLTELRALTQSYPFSSHCIEKAKRRVYADPESNRSWNLAWLVLKKIKDDQLIAYYAQYQAAQSASWGGRTPAEEQVEELSDRLQREWKGAVRQMLRYWEQPPTQ